MWTDRLGEECTSGVAGAVWYPYKVGRSPDDRTERWAAESHAALLNLSRVADSGVVGALPMYLFAGGSEDSTLRKRPEWAGRIPETACVPIPVADLPPLLARHAALAAETIETEGAWRFVAPVVHPARHLRWLRRELGERVKHLSSPVTELASLPGDFVVNSTGRRARSLTKDTELKPAFGQIVVTTDPSFPRDLVFADDRLPEMTYLIPRGEEVVLGGCNLDQDTKDGERPWTSPGGPPVEEELTEAILRRFERLGFKRPASYKALAEWRPVHARRVVLKREDRIVHNYGHGGAGFTLAYGCARAVLEEIRVALSCAGECSHEKRPVF
jgi:D-amino-acid oxidase